MTILKRLMDSFFGFCCWLKQPETSKRGAWFCLIIAILGCLYLLFLYPAGLISGVISLVLLLVGFFVSHDKNSWRLKPGLILFLAVSCVASFRGEIEKYFSRGDIISSEYKFYIPLSKNNINFGGKLFSNVLLPESGIKKYGVTSYGLKMANLFVEILNALSIARDTEQVNIKDEFGLALACTESLLLKDYSERTLNGWDTKFSRISVQTPTGGGAGGYYKRAMGKEIKGETLTPAAISHKFRANPLIKTQPFGLQLPPRTAFEVVFSTSGLLSSKWLIKNDFVEITISLWPNTSVGVKGPEWGIFGEDKYGRVVVVVGTFEAKFNARQSGNSDFPFYQTWVQSMKSSMEELDWDEVQNKLNKEAIQRTAIAVVR